MDSTQLLLTVTLSVTTIFLIIVGIQLIFILRELRHILRKARAVIDGFEKFGGSLENGFHEFIAFFSGIKTLLKVFHLVEKKKHEKTK